MRHALPTAATIPHAARPRFSEALSRLGTGRPTHQALSRQPRLQPHLGRAGRVAHRQCLAHEFLRSPPGNRLEALRGSRAGQYSIRVNDQFRLCFRWTAAGPEDVEIVDYH